MWEGGVIVRRWGQGWVPRYPVDFKGATTVL